MEGISWCQPCRIEMHSIERLHQRLGGGEDFKIFAVSVDEGGDSVVAAFARELGLSFDILHDQSGAIQGAYQTTGVPERWGIDPDGWILKKGIGPSQSDGPWNQA